MPGIIGSQRLDILTEYSGGGGAFLDTDRTYTVVANDVIESGFFYFAAGRTGSKTIDLGLYNITQGNALITTVTLTADDVSVEGWVSVPVNFDLSSFIGDEVAIAHTGPSSLVNTYRASILNNSRSASTTLDNPFVVSSTGQRVYPAYFEVIAGGASFTVTDSLGNPSGAVFGQTSTVTTTNWGAEDPTHVDITGPSSNVLTLPLTATATANEYTFTMPSISEVEGSTVAGLLSGAGTIRVYTQV